MNINDISTQLLYTTVPIYAKNNNGSFSSGTGFIFSVMEQNDTSIPLLITNYQKPTASPAVTTGTCTETPSGTRCRAMWTASGISLSVPMACVSAPTASIKGGKCGQKEQKVKIWSGNCVWNVL